MDDSTLGGADLSGANLANAYLGASGLRLAVFDSSTTYNQWTVFASDFDPSEAGLEFLASARGDFDGNGTLDVADLEMFTEWRRPRGRYEDDLRGNSGWGTGDWDGDNDFTTSDIVLAFRDGGYEKGPRPEAVAVPEPSGVGLLSAGMMMMAILSLRRPYVVTRVR